jgi:hypothetical protein
VDAETLLGSDRAEDLSSQQVLTLFAGASGDDALVAKLMSPGTYLLQGSRGTGKTMLLRVAYERTIRERPDILPVLVSFSRYLATYNISTPQSDAYSPFRNWVFAKLLTGMRESIERLKPEHANIAGAFGPIPLTDYTRRLESHYQDPTVADPSANAKVLGVPETELLEFARLDHLADRVLAVVDKSGFNSVAFYLDEAAQSFAEELQPAFFSLVRHLRHHRISVKAAVYPNITNYGRDFDVGHDAIALTVERQIETPEGMAFFEELVEKRFAGSQLGTALAKSKLQRDLLIKGSGGTPRWFIHLLNRLGHTGSGPIASTGVVAVIKDLPDSTLWPYLKKLKLLSRKRYADAAMQLAQIIVDGLREANRSIKGGTGDKPTCYTTVSLHKTVPFRVHVAMRLLQYAGIISMRGPKKMSGRTRETADMFLMHPAILVKENALYGGDVNPSAEALVSALTEPRREDFREFTRNSPRLLEFRQDDAVETTLCEGCSEEVPPQARFCMGCGRPVAKTSPYEELLSQPTAELDLTPGIKQRVLDDGRFPTVGAIVRATDSELDDIRLIGKARIPLIRYAAEEFLAG